MLCAFIISTLLFHCRTKVEFSSGGESFHCVGQRVLAKGFTHVMPWLGINEKNLPQFKKGEKIEVARVELYEVISLNFMTFLLSPDLILV